MAALLKGVCLLSFICHSHRNILCAHQGQTRGAHGEALPASLSWQRWRDEQQYNLSNARGSQKKELQNRQGKEKLGSNPGEFWQLQTKHQWYFDSAFPILIPIKWVKWIMGFLFLSHKGGPAQHSHCPISPFPRPVSHIQSRASWEGGVGWADRHRVTHRA